MMSSVTKILALRESAENEKLKISIFIFLLGGASLKITSNPTAGVNPITLFGMN